MCGTRRALVQRRVGHCPASVQCSHCQCIPPIASHSPLKHHHNEYQTRFTSHTPLTVNASPSSLQYSSPHTKPLLLLTTTTLLACTTVIITTPQQPAGTVYHSVLPLPQRDRFAPLSQQCQSATFSRGTVQGLTVREARKEGRPGRREGRPGGDGGGGRGKVR
ncbi:hypothetical protein E2C01_078835 [Portunus trituberculatus]|uniref:Uncharacterized protein n=1 Tax=Portunus trituberculatus TaxID=210409 RepID=A0A5B7ITV4_PORTR|nr:hypothetical protein [Portunus trituberculatus]